MTLIKSVSGIRGTIGGSAGDNLTPVDIMKFTTAYVYLMQHKLGKSKLKIVVGRDARLSGMQVYHIVCGTLSSLGADVVNIGMATTPTTEIAVIEEQADGGIILTASHNPKQWNALKLLNNKGEFLTDADGKELLNIAQNHFDEIEFATIDAIGKVTEKEYLKTHIDRILKNRFTDKVAIQKANFKVVVDAVNSVGGIAVPTLLEALGVKRIIKLNCEPTGIFAHNPEPLPENLTEISKLMVKEKAHVGFTVDPDVDRLAIINEDGTMFGEEYTLVSVADYILASKPGNTVSNLSSTRALRDITEKHGGNYSASAVGEVNVVAEMKRVGAVIGGEGNGGIIFPELHYGRDALAGIALFLTHLAKSGISCSQLRSTYPEYFISKNKIELSPGIDVDIVLLKIKETYLNQRDAKISDNDGVKIDFPKGWVHLRKSNTEPIIRVYAESNTPESADALAHAIIKSVKAITRT
jgi:phosphomannomutase